MAGIEDIIGKTGNYNIRDKFKRFDNRFIRPLLIRDLKVMYISIWIIDINQLDYLRFVCRKYSNPNIYILKGKRLFTRERYFYHNQTNKQRNS